MINQILMLGAPAADGQESNPIMTFAPLVLIMIVFYFFMIRPQMKRAKEQKKFRESLKEGDNVITMGGIHGKIVKIEESTVTLDVGNAKIKFERSAIVPNAADTMANAK